jgi:hypothetical protein
MKLTKENAKKLKRYYTIYKIENINNGLIYIGQHRIYRGHSENDGYSGSGVKIKREIEKYGVRAFKKTIMHRVSTIKEANTLERLEIKRYDSTNPKKGYNLSKGGNVFANNINYVHGANIFIKK